MFFLLLSVLVFKPGSFMMERGEFSAH